MSTLSKSWLEQEQARPLCKFRTKLMAVSKPDPETAAEILRDAGEHAGGELLAAAEPAIRWLNTKELPQHIDLETPERQAAWGFAMLADVNRPENEQTWRGIIKASKRLEQEKHMMGALLLGTIKDPKSTIGWGPPASWFYHDPRAKKINMDPATAMILGLQNSRSIQLHEIGHAAITTERSEKIRDLVTKIEALQNKNPDGSVTISQENIDEVQKLHQEYQLRENLWQYTEDAAVNTFGEIEGENFPTDVKLGFLRTYAVITVSRELTKLNDPLKELKEALDAMRKRTVMEIKLTLTPEELAEQEAAEAQEKLREEIQKTISDRLKAASAAYPITRDFMDRSDPKNWEYIGSNLTPETQAIVDELAGDDGLAQIQPALSAARLDTLGSMLQSITNDCASERNRRCDDIFDRYILPELEKLPPLPKMEQELSYKPSSNPGKPGEEIEGPAGKGTPGEGEPSLEECWKNIEDAEKKNAEAEKDKQNIQKDAIKQSMGSKTPLDELPDNLESYEHAVIACQPQIAQVRQMLRAIQKNQKAPDKKSPALLPETGVQDFSVAAYVAYEEKAKSGDPMCEDDYKFFQKKHMQEKPATTRIVFYLDGSGSMHGEQTKKSMTTLAIFTEAAKKSDITITALYSGAGKTVTLLNGEPTEEEKQTIGGILKTGHARGDNEICPEGLSEMLTALEKTTPENKVVGNTHIIFLTDGGSASSQETQIKTGIEAVLNADPSYSFDTIIVDGTTEHPFAKASAKIAPKRDRQKPNLIPAKTPDLIAKEMLGLLSGRFRQMKSFAPKEAKTLNKGGKLAKRKLDEITRDR